MRGSYQGNIPPSNMQGSNFTPDSIDPRGPSQIPDSLTPFPAVNRQLVGTQPVGTQMLPNVYQDLMYKSESSSHHKSAVTNPSVAEILRLMHKCYLMYTKT